jgi:hypothetical protein
MDLVIIRDARGVDVALVECPPPLSHETDDPGAAAVRARWAETARLLAAAPDLLGALEDAIKVIIHDPRYADRDYDALWDALGPALVTIQGIFASLPRSGGSAHVLRSHSPISGHGTWVLNLRVGCMTRQTRATPREHPVRSMSTRRGARGCSEDVNLYFITPILRWRL